MRWSVCQRESVAAESAFDTKNAKMHLTAGRGKPVSRLGMPRYRLFE